MIDVKKICRDNTEGFSICHARAGSVILQKGNCVFPAVHRWALNFSFGLVSFHVMEELREKPRNSLPGGVRDEQKGLGRELSLRT